MSWVKKPKQPQRRTFCAGGVCYTYLILDETFLHEEDEEDWVMGLG